MTDRKLRQAIAAEAARLLQQRKESDYRTARRKAARWYSRQRVAPADLPSLGEIQQEIYALAGLFSSERQHSALNEIRLVARRFLELLADFDPQLSGSAIHGPVLPGAEVELTLARGQLNDIIAVLFDAGYRAELLPEGRLFVFDCYPCLISRSERPSANTNGNQSPEALWRVENLTESIDLSGLDSLLATESLREYQRQIAAAEDSSDNTAADEEDGYHPDFFPTLEMLLNSLETIRLDPQLHPEGDLLYHSLQVYELGLAERPYDEEFLLACLLHDIGMGLDRRHPLDAAWQAIGELVTPRTWFLIENRAEAVEYISSGRIRGALKRSPDFEDLVLLAQCDLKGRVRGAQVSSVEEVLEYLEGLGSAWDDA